jgi:hypothetical protein
MAKGTHTYKIAKWGKAAAVAAAAMDGGDFSLSINNPSAGDTINSMSVGAAGTVSDPSVSMMANLFWTTGQQTVNPSPDSGGAWSCSFNNLPNNTTFMLSVRATSGAGTTVGSQISFSVAY